MTGVAATQLPPTYYTGYGAQVADFLETWIVQTKGRWANRPLKLEQWEKDVLDELYLMRQRADGEMELVYREALIGIARKNGKSTLAAGIALHGLIAAGENAPEVYAAAGSAEQARVVFDQARKFIDASPKLRDWVRPYRSSIECKANGGVFKVLSADGPLQHGLNPSMVVIDELWAHKQHELYYALTTAQGARDNPLIVTITTAGWDRKQVCYQVYTHGEQLAREGIEAMRRERFLHRWYASSPTAAIDDTEEWRKANPSSWIDTEELGRERRRLPDNVFRRLHMNQWTETRDAWIAPHEWDACAGQPLFNPDLATYIGLDVGIKRDSAAIVWGQWHNDDRLHVGELILKPEEQAEGFGVTDVRNILAARASAMAVREITYDPWSFRESAEILADRGLPMVEMPQNASRMAPASEQLYELVQQRRLVHDGSEPFREQVLAAVAAPTDRGGWKISKRKSLERIDAAVALAMMADRAMTLRYEKPQRRGAAFL